jgi:hypothetical protein
MVEWRRWAEFADQKIRRAKGIIKTNGMVIKYFW